VTLGDKLKPEIHKPRIGLLRIILVSGCFGLLFWIGSNQPNVGLAAMLIFAAVLLLIRRGKKAVQHPLLSADKQGFMKHLRLADKTALFDGNNIYHFGLDNGIGVTALWTLVDSLRSEGYRIVCFFDANIYFRLRDNSEIKTPQKRFSPKILKEVFSLQPDEIYVVPSGFQADAFIIETLKALPISFVVTNDRFRDYQASHAFLGKDTKWRKGVEVKAGELRLFQHKFKRGLKI